MSNLCKDALNHLVDYLEGDLDDLETEALEAHFERCPPCMRFFESYRSTGPICREALARQMPGDVQENLLLFLRERNQSPRSPT